MAGVKLLGSNQTEHTFDIDRLTEPFIEQIASGELVPKNKTAADTLRKAGISFPSNDAQPADTHVDDSEAADTQGNDSKDNDEES